MTLKTFAAAILIGAGLIMAGCASKVPVYNVDNAPTPSGRSAQAVKSAIQRAGAGLGWQIREAGAGRLSGTLVLRTHVAEVDIPYGPGGYSIQYRDSQNLDYDGTVIHNRYNAWIQKLDQTIQAQLSIP